MSSKGTLKQSRRAKPKAAASGSGDTPAPDPRAVVNRRGGRIDFTSSLDLVDEASQQSFPASDPPSWNLPDPRDDTSPKDQDMRKKTASGGTLKPSSPASSSPGSSRVEAKTIATETAPERIALLAYELWETRGRPYGTDLEDWFQAERRLNSLA